MDDCVFCQIIEGKVPTEFVYQDEDVVAFRDIHPQAPVHILIIPKKHLENLNAVTEVDHLLMGKIIGAAKVIAASEHINDSGYRLQVNNGANANQVIKHLHFHLLGGKNLNL